MNDVILELLKRYDLKSFSDHENALKEIIQEVALLGMWRSKFFEVGAFYGGTALRILYGLDRFSEDLDFSLLEKNLGFDISKYAGFLQRELEAYGFEVCVEKKIKTANSVVESAFVKADTQVHLLKIGSQLKAQRSKLMKIKIEVDTDPPGDYQTEVVQHFTPTAFSVKTFDLATLFAGKIAATLFRPYKFNVKGRDWYDFLWYISRATPVSLSHLKARMVQSEKWSEEIPLTIEDVRRLMRERVEGLDIEAAKRDVTPFVRDKAFVEAWSKDLLTAACSKLTSDTE